MEERSEWLLARDSRHPVLVAADDGGAVIGWGSLNPFNPRPAYDHVVDFSCYVARERRGRGIGDALRDTISSLWVSITSREWWTAAGSM